MPRAVQETLQFQNLWQNIFLVRNRSQYQNRAVKLPEKVSHAFKYTDATCSLTTCLIVTWTQLLRAHTKKDRHLNLSRSLGQQLYIFCAKWAWDLQKTDSIYLPQCLEVLEEQDYTYSLLVWLWRMSHTVRLWNVYAWHTESDGVFYNWALGSSDAQVVFDSSIWGPPMARGDHPTGCVRD